MYKNSLVHRIAKITVDILFFGGIGFLLCVPLWRKIVMDAYGLDVISSLPLIILIVLAGLLTLYILFNLKRMYKTLLGANPFVWENVKSLRKIAVACALIALMFLIRAVVFFSVGTVLIVIIFSVGCLFCLTLKDLFKQAIAYKEENEWTV